MSGEKLSEPKGYEAPSRSIGCPSHLKNAIGEGRRPELAGGGLIRSRGGWSAEKAMRRSKERELIDDLVAALISFDSFLIL